jgi:hypothetical protein
VNISFDTDIETDIFNFSKEETLSPMITIRWRKNKPSHVSSDNSSSRSISFEHPALSAAVFFRLLTLLPFFLYCAVVLVVNDIICLLIILNFWEYKNVSGVNKQ